MVEAFEAPQSLAARGGQALARHGDPNGAIEQFKLANTRGPRWADPLKAWGDVLAKQGSRKEALEKLQQAIQFAPTWVALKGDIDGIKYAHKQ